MDLGTKNANLLISKDFKESQKGACDILDHKDIATIRALYEKFDNIFDFLRQKIADVLFSATNKNNLKNTFEFAKFYLSEFEDFIVKAWIKFSDEDLTDEILEMFDKGTVEQKAYCASYFSKIQDTLALDNLKKYAFDDFEPLSYNCAVALKKFGNKEIYSLSLNILKDNTKDDFEKHKAAAFLITYGEEKTVEIIIDLMKDSPFICDIASRIAYSKPLSQMKFENSLTVFDAIIGALPEEISPQCVVDLEIYKYLKFLAAEKLNTQNCSSVFLKAKHVFELIGKNDIYTYDLSKSAKEEIKKINDFFATFDDKFYAKQIESVIKELNNDNTAYDILRAFDVVSSYNIKAARQKIEDLITASKNQIIICEGIRTLKNIDLLDPKLIKEIEKNITDPNIKAMVDNYFNA